MKKLSVMILLAAILLMLTACQENTEPKETVTTTQPQSVTTQTGDVESTGNTTETTAVEIQESKPAETKSEEKTEEKPIQGPTNSAEWGSAGPED